MINLVAVAVAVYAVIWWLRARDFAVPAAGASSLLIYLVVRQQTRPYLTAKPVVDCRPSASRAQRQADHEVSCG